MEIITTRRSSFFSRVAPAFIIFLACALGASWIASRGAWSFNPTFFALNAPSGFYYATPVLVQSQGSDGGTTSLTITVNPTGSGNLLVVTYYGYADEVIDSITDNAPGGSNTYVSAGADGIDTVGGDSVATWYVQNSKPGATTVTVNLSTSEGAVLWFMEVANMDLSAPVVQAAVLDSQPAATSESAPTDITSLVPEFVVSIAAPSSHVTGLHAGNPFTALPIQSGGDTAYLIPLSTGSYTAIWDQPSTTFASSTVSFKPLKLAGQAPSVTPTQLGFTTAPQSLATWTCSGMTTVELQTGGGTAAYVGTGTTVNLSASGLNFFSDSACTNSISSVSIGAGTSSQRFYFNGSASGSEVITAAATGLTSATQTETISLAPYTWIGGAGCNQNWATGACWQGGSAPGITNIAQFDGNCVTNCSPTLSAGIDVGGIGMHAGYLGTLTQGSHTITTEYLSGFNSFELDSGTFAGGTAAMTVNGPFVLAGGTFTAPNSSGSLTLAANGISAPVFTVSGSPTFHANGGTVTFGYASVGAGAITPGSIPFNNVTFSGTNDTAINIVGTMNIGGNLTIANDSSSGFNATNSGATLAVAGNVTATSGLHDIANGTDNTTLDFVGTSNQSITGTTDCLPGSITINNTGSGGNNIVTLPSTVTLHGGIWTYVAGVVNAAASTVDVVYNATLNDSVTQFNNVTFAATNGGSPTIVGTLNVGGTLTLSNETSTGTTLSGGTINASGNVVMTSGASGSGGNTAITFTGGNAQTYTSTGGTLPDAAVTVNKTAGTILTLSSNMSLPNGGQQFTISSGKVKLNGNTLNVANTVAVTGASAILQCNGGCGAGTSCGLGLNELRCGTLSVTSGGTVTP